MSRPVCLAALIIVMAVSCGCPRRSADDTVEMPSITPLEAAPDYVVFSEEFFSRWQNDDAEGAHAMLTGSFRRLVDAQTLAVQMAEVVLEEVTPKAFAASGEAAFVILAVETAQGDSTDSLPPIASYSLLLKKEDGEWRVAIFLADEKRSEQYNGLILRPAGQGYEVTYTDETGLSHQLQLQEL